MRRTSIALFLLVSAFLFPFYTGSAQDIPEDSGKVITVESFPSLNPIPRNGSFELGVRIHIKPGWHINGHEGLPAGFVPLEISPAADSHLDLLEPIQYPLGVLRSLGGSEKPFPVYENEVGILLKVKVKDIPYKEIRLQVPFKIHLQACNDKVCLRPADVIFTTEVSLPLAGQNSEPANAEYFKTLDPSGNPEALPPDNIILKFISEKGILITFLLILLGGLALNLTPCVYPMIPLTVSYFGSQKDEKPMVILGRAAAYVVGISLTYSTLGVTAALTGKILGSTLQSPWVLAGISTLLVVLSFSMFGLYEIQAPAWMLNRVAAGNTRGWMGALGMGLVFGIVAAPCVDPFSIGLLTYVAAKANPFLGFIMFFTLSLGLGFPYLWLGFFSTSLQKLPKSGLWMVWVKKVFGLILLGMPFYFLNPLLPKGFSHFAVPAYLALCGLLLGWVFTENQSWFHWIGALFHRKDYFKKFQHAFGTSMILAGLLVYHFWPQPVDLPFQVYDQALLKEAQKEKKPVFIDFTASWCLPCKELEVKTFSDPRVHDALGGWVLLKADLTQYSSGPVEALKKNYGIMGVPTLVFLEADGVEEKGLRAVGFISPDELLQKLNQTEK